MTNMHLKIFQVYQELKKCYYSDNTIFASNIDFKTFKKNLSFSFKNILLKKYHSML